MKLHEKISRVEELLTQLHREGITLSDVRTIVRVADIAATEVYDYLDQRQGRLNVNR